MKLLRPQFDAALASLPPDLYVDIGRRDAIWHALTTTAAAAQKRLVRWSPEAVALLTPLDRELEALRQHQRSGSIVKRYADVRITLKRGAKPAQTFVVMDVYAQYGQRLLALRERISSVLRDAGHWCASTDDPELKQPLAVIVANERAQERPAGTLDWTQWEAPNVVRAVTQVFEQARIATNAASKPGRQWAPYVPNTGKAGAADMGKAMGKWRGAFHDAIHNALDAYRPDMRAAALVRFFEGLKTPQAQARIEDACRAQVKLRRSPDNRAFTNASASIWHALDNQTRLELAAGFNASLLECAERLLAQGDRDGAAEFSPAIIYNPFELDGGPRPAFDTYQTPEDAPEPEEEDDTPDDTPEPNNQFADLLARLNADEPEPDQH